MIYCLQYRTVCDLCYGAILHLTVICGHWRMRNKHILLLNIYNFLCHHDYSYFYLCKFYNVNSSVIWHQPPIYLRPVSACQSYCCTTGRCMSGLRKFSSILFWSSGWASPYYKSTIRFSTLRFPAKAAAPRESTSHDAISVAMSICLQIDLYYHMSKIFDAPSGRCGVGFDSRGELGLFPMGLCPFICFWNRSVSCKTAMSQDKLYFFTFVLISQLLIKSLHSPCIYK